MPSCLLLDVMGTICHDPFYVEVPEFFGLTLAELLAQKHPTSWRDWELGALQEEEFLPTFFADARAFDHAGLKECYRRAFRFLPGMEELLAQLHGAGHDLHLFSNYTTWYRLIEEKLRLARFARWSCVSCHLGARKPDPEAYRRALAVVGGRAADCTFVDDREVNCAAAEGLGIRALRFRDSAGLRGDLRAAGILPPAR